MKIYEVHNGAEFGAAYYLTKAEALRESKALIADEPGDPERFAVDLLETTKTDRHGILAMLRGEHWVAKRTRIWPKEQRQ